MGSKVPRKMRGQGRGRPVGRMRPFGDRVRTGRIRIGVNLLSSLTTGRVLEGELGYNQLVVLVAVHQSFARELYQPGGAYRELGVGGFDITLELCEGTPGRA